MRVVIEKINPNSRRYRIIIPPGDGIVPELPFLHQGDRYITTANASYVIISAAQVENTSYNAPEGIVYSWVYVAEKDS